MDDKSQEKQSTDQSADPEHDNPQTERKTMSQTETASELEQAYLDEAASASISMTIDSSNSEQEKTSERLEQAKIMSRQYLNYYGNAIKEPVQSLSRTDESHFQNALITMGIIAILFPLFIVLTTVRIGVGISFSGMIMQPFIYAALSMVAAVGAIYVFGKWQGNELHWKQITVQYATLLVPVPLCLIIASLLGLIGLSARLTMFFFILSMLFILIALNVLLIRQQTSLSSTNVKLDPIYSIAISNVIVGFFLYKIATSAIGALVTSLFRSWIPF